MSIFKRILIGLYTVFLSFAKVFLALAILFFLLCGYAYLTKKDVNGEIQQPTMKELRKW